MDILFPFYNMEKNCFAKTKLFTVIHTQRIHSIRFYELNPNINSVKNTYHKVNSFDCPLVTHDLNSLRGESSVVSLFQFKVEQTVALPIIL